ncbi:MAG TPA: tRNA (adenosine(37)-N6)-threonylcarbamoyltransferase complex dimerization subunit type 1 TsaB [Solirubrobacteraceae bacterium]
MIVLGFDTATPATAVALRLADGTTLRARDDPGTGERPGHTTRLLALASELLGEAGLRWGAVQRIAVGVGPGTFTGLRVGVAMARGLAQSLGIDVVGISTLRVLAEAAFAEGGSQVMAGTVLAAIDARRGEAFVAAYALGEMSSAEAPPRARELAGARALAPEALGALLAEAGTGRDWLAVGDGAIRFRAQMEALGVAVPAEDSSLHRVDAGVLCELALAAPSDAIETVLPNYRRRPDAEIALESAEP